MKKSIHQQFRPLCLAAAAIASLTVLLPLSVYAATTAQADRGGIIKLIIGFAALVCSVALPMQITNSALSGATGWLKDIAEFGKKKQKSPEEGYKKSLLRRSYETRVARDKSEREKNIAQYYTGRIRGVVDAAYNDKPKNFGERMKRLGARAVLSPLYAPARAIGRIKGRDYVQELNNRKQAARDEADLVDPKRQAAAAALRAAIDQSAAPTTLGQESDEALRNLAHNANSLKRAPNLISVSDTHDFDDIVQKINAGMVLSMKELEQLLQILQGIQQQAAKTGEALPMPPDNIKALATSIDRALAPSRESMQQMDRAEPYIVDMALRYVIEDTNHDLGNAIRRAAEEFGVKDKQFVEALATTLKARTDNKDDALARAVIGTKNSEGTWNQDGLVAVSARVAAFQEEAAAAQLAYAQYLRGFTREKWVEKGTAVPEKLGEWVLRPMSPKQTERQEVMASHADAIARAIFENTTGGLETSVQAAVSAGVWNRELQELTVGKVLKSLKSKGTSESLELITSGKFKLLLGESITKEGGEKTKLAGKFDEDIAERLRVATAMWSLTEQEGNYSEPNYDKEVHRIPIYLRHIFNPDEGDIGLSTARGANGLLLHSGIYDQLVTAISTGGILGKNLQAFVDNATIADLTKIHDLLKESKAVDSNRINPFLDKLMAVITDSKKQTESVWATTQGATIYEIKETDATGQGEGRFKRAVATAKSFTGNTSAAISRKLNLSGTAEAATALQSIVDVQKKVSLGQESATDAKLATSIGDLVTTLGQRGAATIQQAAGAVDGALQGAGTRLAEAMERLTTALTGPNLAAAFTAAMGQHMTTPGGWNVGQTATDKDGKLAIRLALPEMLQIPLVAGMNLDRDQSWNLGYAHELSHFMLDLAKGRELGSGPADPADRANEERMAQAFALHAVGGLEAANPEHTQYVQSLCEMQTIMQAAGQQALSGFMNIGQPIVTEGHPHLEDIKPFWDALSAAFPRERYPQAYLDNMTPYIGGVKTEAPFRQVDYMPASMPAPGGSQISLPPEFLQFPQQFQRVAESLSTAMARLNGLDVKVDVGGLKDEFNELGLILNRVAKGITDGQTSSTQTISDELARINQSIEAKLGSENGADARAITAALSEMGTALHGIVNAVTPPRVITAV
jgi:hypothetical protein